MGAARRGLVALGLSISSVLISGVAAAQSPPPPVINFPPFDPAACVAKPQRLLILDMKSGWWSGDGDQFHNVLLPRIVKDCPSIEIEYYFLQHIGAELPPGVTLPPGLPPLENGIFGMLSFYPERPNTPNDALMSSVFPTRQWNEYSQAWLLSGSNEDPTDVPTDHDFFVKLLTKYTTASVAGQTAPGLFIGTGIGNRDHANRVLATLQLPELFQTHLTSIDTPAVPDGSVLETRTRARAGAELTAHPLFEGVESIVDTLAISAIDYETDFLPVANNPFTAAGRNTKGEPAIGVRETPERRMVIDAGIHRYYSLFKPEETATYRYLQNIIKWLAR